MNIFFIITAFLNGTLLSIQQVSGALLGKRVGSLGSSLIVHVIGACFAGCLLVFGLKNGEFRFSGIPFLYFLGGGLGIFGVAMGNYAVPRIGAVCTAIFSMAFQLLTSSLIDHFGFLGADPIALSLSRFIGICLLIGGAVLVFKK
ncbi:MAG: DMT family transporter [Deltaproteobacteria bacterium]|nr:DMT family transporter [Deltaproteobacteria bacterium]